MNALLDLACALTRKTQNNDRYIQAAADKGCVLHLGATGWIAIERCQGQVVAEAHQIWDCVASIP